MTQKKMKSVRRTVANREAPKMKQKKMKSVHRTVLANREAPKVTQKALKKKKSNANTKKSNLSNQISDSEKFKLIKCKQKKKKKKKSVHTCDGKRVVEPSQMDIVADSQGILSKDDIVMEILSWLPVRSLFRFKCVSKSWDVTSDPYFKVKHQSHLANPLRFLLLHYDCTMTRTRSCHSFYSTSSLSSAEDAQKLDNLPSNNDSLAYRMLFGSCDGLVLIGVASRVNDQLVLWNPSTRESILLPLPGFKILGSTFGLGYDTTIDDYKILAIHCSKTQLTVKPCYGILALKSGSWIKFPLKNFYPLRDGHDCMDTLVFLHGAFHWLLDGSKPSLISLSISNVGYRKIPLLEKMHQHIPFYAKEYGLSVFEGMLCFFSTFKVRDEGTFKLWAMKDYAVEGSWTQLFNIKVAGLYVAKPIYSFADGDVLLKCYIDGIYSLRTSKGPFGLWSDSFIGPLKRFEIITFKESFISPKSLI